MCGIFGVICNNGSTLELINALKKLEYRGYDSAGIAYFKNNNIKCIKEVGNVSFLSKKVKKEEMKCGIAHTRWATHGEILDQNAHPHYSNNKKIYIVHNGVITNYLYLKNTFFKNENFISQTDTEIIVHLLERFIINSSMEEAIKKTMKVIEGTYALLIMNVDEPDAIYFAKYKSPLLIGQRNEEIYFSSDINVFELGTKYLILEDKTYGKITSNKMKILSFNYNPIPKFEMVSVNNEYEKKEEHYMLQEIFEQGNVISNIYNKYHKYSNKKLFEDITTAKRIIILGAGSSYYAGLYIKKYFSEYLSKETNVYLASEYPFTQEWILEDAFYIFLSQSGETADLIRCLDLLKKKKKKNLLLTNSINSTLSRNSTYTLDLCAGIEKSVASTKAYIAMCVLPFILVSKIKGFDYSNDLLNLIESIETVLLETESIKEYSNIISKCEKVFYIAKADDINLAYEASLKLREVTYINSFAFPSGELKHGSIALVDNKTMIIAFISKNETKDLILSNMEEAICRKAKSIVIAYNDLELPQYNFKVKNNSILSSLTFIIYSQLFAYYSGINLGLNVDQPRNLAKSVTVE